MPAIALRSLAFSVLALPLAVAAAAAADAVSAPILELPVACQIGALCVVQNYVDQDPGPGAADHTCGPLSYDGHKGVDFRIAGWPEMAAGVAVLAAAPGVVRALLDGEADRAASQAGPDAGNAVVLDHAGGWESQYSHTARAASRSRPVSVSRPARASV